MYKGKTFDSLPFPHITDRDQHYHGKVTSESVSDIPEKAKSTAELVGNTSELNVPALCPSFALTVTYYKLRSFVVNIS